MASRKFSFLHKSTLTLSQALFLSTLASIPLQLNKYIFVKSSLVLGIPVDYRAISIYASDFLTIALVLTFIFENRKSLLSIFNKYKNIAIPLLILNFYLIASSIFFSRDPQISIVFNAKTLLFSVFCIICAFYFSKKELIDKSYLVVAFSLLWQSFLAIWQFLFQKSANFYFLGERSFDTTTTAIAHFSLFGNQLLRPYGTFPHPNVLAAFLIIFALVLMSQETTWSKIQKRLDLIKTALLLALCASLVTFSKTALFIVALLPLVNSSKKTKIILSLALLSLAYFYISLFAQNYLNSIAERLQLIQASLEIIRHNLFVGTGSNNFIPALSKLNIISVAGVRLLQPVHNVFLLILAENGLLGLLFFALLLFRVFKYCNTWQKTYIFFALLIYMSTDHFFWTLQQGRLLFFFALGFILSSHNKASA